MKRLFQPVIGAMVISGISMSASACVYGIDMRSLSQIRQQSVAVSMDAQCRMINGGVSDFLALGPVKNLGNGRILHVVNEDSSLVFLADCNTREATMLRGTRTIIGETSCGPDFTNANLVGDDAIMSMSDGADLHDLIKIAREIGVSEVNPISYFFEFTISHAGERYEVGRKDRLDLLCGCNIYYSDSLGASQ